MTLKTKALYEFDKFRCDPAEQLLSREGKPVSLTPKAFEILVTLVQSNGRLLTKEELMQKVWPDSFVEEANLTVNISALRKILGETSAGQQYIETVPKRGYRFLVPVKELKGDEKVPARKSSVAEESDFSQKSPGTVAEQPPHDAAFPVRRKAIWRNVVISVTLLALVVVAAYFYQTRFSHRQIAPPPRRLAILPFRNLGQNPNSDFLGLSLADAVISKLGYVSALTVRPSYATEKYRNQTIDIKKVASELNVDTLLTGGFIHDGDDLRITCQLIDVKTENLLWKGAFDLRYDKLLTVQDNVAQQIIKGLELSLSPSEAERLKPDELVDPLAYEYYLRGVDLYTRNDFPTAIKMLERSAEIGPNYALTWAYLGRAYHANASFHFGGSEQYRKAQSAFERALALQPTQIEARIYMANHFTDTGRVEEAVPLLREALRTNPNHAEIHWELGYAYRFAGMLKESVAESEQARQLDPGVKLNSSTVNGYLYLGEYDRFLQSLPPGNDISLIVFYKGFAQYYQGRQSDAAGNFAHAFELNPDLFQAQIGQALNYGINHQEAKGVSLLQQTEQKLHNSGAGDPEAVYKIGQAYAVLGDKKSALRVLRESVDTGFFPYPYMANDPLLSGLHGENEFADILSKARQRHEAFKKTFFG
jgi:DNA-binding winged helix-turn-helix (wHTH) protein/TolB-like protein